MAKFLDRAAGADHFDAGGLYQARYTRGEQASLRRLGAGNATE